MSRPFLILQHVACEPAAAYEDALSERGLGTTIVRADQDELPDWWAFSGIIAMGGPMGACDPLPWLDREKEYIAESVRAGLPYWGVCLGAQLLAAALGSDVMPADSPEIGVLPVELSSAATEDPVFRNAPDRFMALHWHSDTYVRPEGATHLASSEAIREQAFRVGRAYGLQFHLEVPVALAEEWAALPAYAESLEAALGPGALGPLMDDLKRQSDAMLEVAGRLMEDWVDGVVLPSLLQNKR